ncbi:MAG: DEAD/DEAH box helicase [Spirochaetaceae bacterium]
MTFNEISLDESILSAVDKMGFINPTPVQESVIPEFLKNSRDIIALAQTGTGKTAAFGLPILDMLKDSPRETGALVLCPTRELAIQITKEMKAYAAHLPHITIDAVYGGAGYADQIRSLKKGVHILVATPGRLLDLIHKGKTDFSGLEYLVLDEADIMLNMGFKEELDAILEAVPQQRRTLLLSATMPAEVARIAATYMHDPVTITMGQKNAAAESVEHFSFTVHPREKYAALKRLVDYHPDIYGIVFCRTKISTQDIAEKLIGDGYNADALHGDLSQAQREQVMKKFRNQNLQLLVATDIASRGLDVQNLSHVIHYDLPDEIDIYTHRSGRTGRAGKTGVSYVLLGPRESSRLKHIERVIQRKITGGTIPKGDDIFRRRLVDFTERLSSTEVNEVQIKTHLDALKEQIGDMSRDELLQKIVSMQFEQMMEYYHGLPDMKSPEAAKRGGERDYDRKKGGNSRFRQSERGGRKNNDPSGKEKRDSRKGQSGGPGRSGGAGYNNGVEEGFESIHLNIGKKDKVAPPDLIGLVNQSSRKRGIEIGRINIHPSFSTLQVEDEHAASVAGALDGFTYRGRTLRAQLKKGA